MQLQTLEDVMGWASPPEHPSVKYYYNVAQHSPEWYAVRCGIITASVMKNLIKKKTDKKTGEVSYSVPDNDTTKAYLFELAAQRFNGYTVEGFQGFAMERGIKDEVDSFNIYSENYDQLRTCGFITNTEYGFVFGYSPDGLTALHDDGQIEAKGRMEKFQIEAIYYNEMPEDFEIQVQSGLIVSKRKWCDFICYRDGMPLFKKRILPDDVVQFEIIKAAQKADTQIDEIVATAKKHVQEFKFLPTEKRVEDITA